MGKQQWTSPASDERSLGGRVDVEEQWYTRDPKVSEGGLLASAGLPGVPLLAVATVFQRPVWEGKV